MASYYKKVTRIFLVGENYLFHAAAWSSYYNLLCQSAQIVGSPGETVKTVKLSTAYWLVDGKLVEDKDVPVDAEVRSTGRPMTVVEYVQWLKYAQVAKMTAAPMG